MFTTFLRLAIAGFLGAFTSAEVGEHPVPDAGFAKVADVESPVAAVGWTPAVSSDSAIFITSIFDEVVAALADDTARRALKSLLPDFEAQLQPMFASTPTNEYGNWGHSAVRYTLHRLFVQRHGWFVNGLYAGQGGTQWSNASVTSLLMEHVPLRARYAFERRLSREGLRLKEAALLAATIENSILDDGVGGLRESYHRSDLPINASIGPLQAENLLRMFLAQRLCPEFAAQYEKRWKIKSRNQYIRLLERKVGRVYKGWNLTVKFLHDLRVELAPNRTLFEFDHVADIVIEVERRWARWTALKECQDIKSKLIEIEEGKSTGCVRLSAFYKRSLEPLDGYIFTEPPSYLSELGALDDANQEDPALIIPNYIQSPGQCLASSSLYQACCVNECDELQLQIERALQKPDGRPEEIKAVVKSLPSATSPAFNAISSSLSRRLNDIAGVHDGRVPLQGRLFAQWMHFAYPHECPFPHLAGTTKPRLGTFADHVNDTTVLRYIQAGNVPKVQAGNGTCMHWRREEELFVPTMNPPTTTLAELEEDVFVWISMYFVGALASLTLIAGVLLRSAWLREKKAQSIESKVAMLV